jgi:hypothetical protein
MCQCVNIKRVPPAYYLSSFHLRPGFVGVPPPSSPLARVDGVTVEQRVERPSFHHQHAAVDPRHAVRHHHLVADERQVGRAREVRHLQKREKNGACQLEPTAGEVPP